MVAVFVVLKLRLLANGFRTSNAVAILTALSIAAGLAATSLGLFLIARLPLLDAVDVRTVLVIGGSMLVLGWTVLPIAVFGVDETTDPARFALLPLPHRTLLAGMLAAGFVGVPAATTTILGLGTVLAWRDDVLAALFALAGAVVAVATCVAASRCVTTALAQILRSRRARDLAPAAGLFVAAFIWIGQASAFGGLRLSTEFFRQAADVLAWTPLGAAWAAPYDAVTGSPLLGLARLGIAAATLLAVLAGWSSAFRRTLENGVTASAGKPGRTSGGSGIGPTWASRLLPSGAAGTVAERTVSYVWRDPRQRPNTIFLPVAGGVLLLLPVAGGPDTFALMAGLITAGFAAMTMLNHTAFDGTALWLHLATGLTGSADRRGRARGLLAWTLPVVVVAAVAGPLLAGRPELVPADVGASLAVLLAGIAVASVTSVVAPFPAPPPGANPFTTPGGGNAAAVIQQMVAGLVVLGLAIPPMILLALSVWWNAGAGVVLLAAGPVYGWVLLHHATRIGGRHLDRHGPEVMVRITPTR